jgi:WD40 repeat protein
MHINASSVKGKDKLFYGAGRFAFVRDLENPAQCEYFAGHQHKVNVVSPSPNGNWVVSGDECGDTKVWGYPNIIVKTELRIGQCINDARWSADSQKIIAGGNGSQEYAKAFRYDSTNPMGKVDRLVKGVLSLDMNPKGNRVATADEGNEVLFYSGPPFKYLTRQTPHTRYPNVLRYSPDGNVFMTASSDSKVVVYDGNTGDKLRELDGGADAHTGAIFGFAWSPSGKEFVTASADKTVKVWDFESGAVTRTWQVSTAASADEFADQLASVAWTPAGKIVAVSISGVITVFAPDQDAPVDVIYGHSKPVTALAVDRAHGQAFSGDLVGNIAVWDVARGTAKWFSGSSTGTAVNAMAVSSDSKYLYYASLDNTVRVASTSAHEYGSVLVSSGAAISAIATGRTDPDMCVFVTKRGDISLVRAGRVVATTTVKEAVSVAINSDDTEIAVGGGSAKVTFFFKISGDSLEANGVSPDEIQAAAGPVAYGPNNIVVSTQHKDIHVWKDSRDGVRNFGWSYHTHLISALKFSPSGTKLASASHDKSAIIWNDLETFKGARNTQLSELHLGGVNLLEWVDDETLITSGDDGVVKCIKIKA